MPLNQISILSPLYLGSYTTKTLKICDGFSLHGYESPHAPIVDYVFYHTNYDTYLLLLRI